MSESNGKIEKKPRKVKEPKEKKEKKEKPVPIPYIRGCDSTICIIIIW